MPCYTSSTVEIDSGKMNAGLAKDAFAAMGLNPRHERQGIIDHRKGSYNYQTGETVWRVQRGETAEQLTAELKRAYSAEVIKSQARKYGWTLKQTSQYEYAVTKR